MLSDSWKSAFKMASEDPQKNIAKKYEKHEIVWLLQQFLRPYLFILSTFWDHFSMVSFS